MFAFGPDPFQGLRVTGEDSDYQSLTGRRTGPVLSFFLPNIRKYGPIGISLVPYHGRIDSKFERAPALAGETGLALLIPHHLRGSFGFCVITALIG